MKKIILVLGCACCLSFTSCVLASEISWQDISGGNTRLKTILVDPHNPRLIYIGSDQGIFKSEDAGLNWRNILSIRGQNKTVNFLLSDPQNSGLLYAATGNGLYRSLDQGKNWKRIFQGKDYSERECTTLRILPYAIYLGTKSGLFVSKDKGRSWYKEAGNIGKSIILAIACNVSEPDYIYIACVDGVFRSKDKGESWERVFVANVTDSQPDEGEDSDDQDEASRCSDIRYISIDPNNPAHIYLATSRGVYKSHDRAMTWEALPDYGLLNKDVRFLLISDKSGIYAVSKSGVFKYDNQRWQELSFGLASSEINFLSLDKEDNLYAATDKGLFKANPGYLSSERQENAITLYYKNEPQIDEVQEIAIKYAEVEPEKIMRWRKQAAKKALLPQVSVGVGRNTTDLWHWESGSSTKTEDDILRRGHDSIDWDVTLSWNLSEFIWNDDQTSIDVRSRLTAQLRDDILDELNKTYFERLRVKMELDNLSIEDRKKRCEKELRLEELTASLDALTGGYFSQQIKSKTES